jgi:hypothetical protein
MAGSFGFEVGKYEVSKTIVEGVLAPIVRAVEPDTLFLSNDFSCRQRIER